MKLGLILFVILMLGVGIWLERQRAEEAEIAAAELVLERQRAEEAAEIAAAELELERQRAAEAAEIAAAELELERLYKRERSLCAKGDDVSCYVWNGYHRTLGEPHLCGVNPGPGRLAICAAIEIADAQIKVENDALKVIDVTLKERNDAQFKENDATLKELRKTKPAAFRLLAQENDATLKELRKTTRDSLAELMEARDSAAELMEVMPPGF